MSARLSRRIRQQRRAQRKAAKQRSHQSAPGDEQAAVSPAAGAELPTSAYPVARRATSRNGRTARLAALVAGCAVALTVGGSAVFDLAGEADQPEPLRVPLNYVAAPAVTERLVCPPTPGSPDSLSEAGVVDYDERDSSAESSRSAVLFASASGVTPGATWTPLTAEGPDDDVTFQEESRQERNSAQSLVRREISAGELSETTAPAVLAYDPVEGEAPETAAAAAVGFSYQAAEGPQSGLVARECGKPIRSQWFLGPETGAGSTSLLTLTNPHHRDAAVEVTTHSAEGATGSLGATTVLVPGGSVRTVDIASLTADAAQLAVHVQASGATVAAHLQSSRASGNVGEGTDLLLGLVAPQEEHHMLAVPAGADERPQLWVYDPGDTGGAVELQVFGPDGQETLDTPGVFSVEPAQVTVVDLEGLDAGTYEVVVRSEEPTLAAVRSAGDGEAVTVETEAPAEPDPETGEQLGSEVSEEEVPPQADISWSQDAEPLSSGSGTVLPQSGESELRLLGHGVVRYRLFDSAGEASDELAVELADPSATFSVAHDELLEQAEDSGLEDLFALVVADTEGEARAGILTRDEQGHFSIGALPSINHAAEYVPLRFER